MHRLNKLLRFFGILGLGFSFWPAAAGAAAEEIWYIDRGFLGRPVGLDILGGFGKLAWNSGDVLYPSDVFVSASSSEVELRWSTSYALGKKGVEIGLRAEMFSATTSDPWQELALEAKEPFGIWRKLESRISDGFVMAKVGPEARIRLVSAPRGMRSGTATWYRHKGCLCAASPDFPKGTKLKVSSANDPARSVIVTVNDWGPDRKLFPTRVIDLDSLAFKKLAPLGRGKLQVTVEPLAGPSAVTVR